MNNARRYVILAICRWRGFLSHVCLQSRERLGDIESILLFQTLTNRQVLRFLVTWNSIFLERFVQVDLERQAHTTGILIRIEFWWFNSPTT